ncbi:extracellular solute-binding protein [Motiliproteus sp. MSK22-1]|uniref:extracellular solute-binding protein n=1 Tax=Motiliproteus sp. MSK22-1 TaxID=1897630 RepID=UPI000977A6DF|nr:extracellular solute-binding protein [Motiliproteus sp. MSK22-1]OMH29529.1 antibiotic ABC transporter substrate-binding protein [Motiliproteus sp. MSK22-1]
MPRIIVTFLLALAVYPVWASPEVISAHAVALRGTPKYQPDFQNFDYVNPDAPKGGTLRLHSIGTFDNFNRFAQRGDAATASDQLYDTLFVTSDDEIGVYYPLIAEKVDFADDYSFVTFSLNPDARFQDQTPITADDVKFTFEKFSTEGVVQFKRYYSFVKDVEVLSRHQVKFSLEGANKEQMLSLFTLTILPQHYWESRNFKEPLKEIPIGSSGITVKDYKFGQYIIYEHLDNYWAKDLPVNKGRNNFKYIRYDYYRDAIVAFEAFKSGEFDFWQESEAKNWATAYDFPAFTDKKVLKEQLPHSIPQRTDGFIFNSKRPQFSDQRVREALAYMIDFEWMNKALFYNQYTRTESYFTNTEFAATGLPDDDELEILTPLKGKIPEQVFTKEFKLPTTKGDGNIRNNMRQALRLLKSAGWELKDRKLVNSKTGKPFEFELLSYRPLTERIAAPFKSNLAKIGITLNLRQVDSTQFINRVREHDFDMVSFRYSANPYPSSSLKIIWRSDFVDSTWNIANVTDPAIDALIDGINTHQENPRKLQAYGRALDRTLLWNFYIIPQWHLSAFRIAYWDKFSRPESRPLYSLGIDTWWQNNKKPGADQ